MTPGATAPPGTEILPGYTVVGVLGHGRRVDTYDAYSQLRECRCVVKAIRPDRTEDTRAREAVIREGTLLRDLSHPHLVRGYEVISTPLPAMVLETLSGATLGALIEDAPLDPADTAQLGLHLVSALSYLHRCGWLHLDVKPANIVVEAGRAKLIDLSLVGRPGPGRPGAGTYGYLAPEQARGLHLSAATDVWGLGVSLIESMTGELPFGNVARWGIRDRVRLLAHKAARSLRGVNGLPDDLHHLLVACIQLEPARRPALDDIRRCLASVA